MKLYSRAAKAIELMSAIKQCAEVLFQSPPVALLYTPYWSGFAQVERSNGSIEMIPALREEASFDPALVFEARVFNDHAELRWLKQWPNGGRAALIAEEDISECLDDEIGTFEVTDSIDQTYLLWGEGAGAKPGELRPGWSRLAMARIGVLDVPYPLDTRRAVSGSGERIHLLAREYLSADEHGNVGVVEERLRKLARA
jgi:CRISPR-associated protein (TIGR03984 family)